jgi:hypothetical protein
MTRFVLHIADDLLFVAKPIGFALLPCVAGVYAARIRPGILCWLCMAVLAAATVTAIIRWPFLLAVPGHRALWVSAAVAAYAGTSVLIVAPERAAAASRRRYGQTRYSR